MPNVSMSKLLHPPIYLKLGIIVLKTSAQSLQGLLSLQLQDLLNPRLPPALHHPRTPCHEGGLARAPPHLPELGSGWSKLLGPGLQIIIISVAMPCSGTRYTAHGQLPCSAASWRSSLQSLHNIIDDVDAAALTLCLHNICSL